MSGILGMFENLFKPVWSLATNTTFWIIFVSVIAFAFCAFLLYPFIKSLLFMAGKLITGFFGLMYGGI